jgi:hypothetical protein
MAEILDTVKTVLRITHTKLDDEITREIDTAKAELQRAGVSADTVSAEGKLVTEAVATYCLMMMSEDPDLMDKYREAWDIQCDMLRRSSDVQ